HLGRCKRYYIWAAELAGPLARTCLTEGRHVRRTGGAVFIERIPHDKLWAHVILMAATALIGLAPEVVAQTRQPGVPQPAPAQTVVAAPATKPAAGDDEPNPLLTSPDAVLAATYRCDTDDEQHCPLRLAIAADIDKHFHEPLKAGSGPAPLAEDLEKVL